MSTTIVTIPDCSAEQLLDSGAVPVSTGPLSVLQAEEGFPMTLKINDLAFPLPPESQVFTHSESPLWYFFKTPAGYVKITLPTQATAPGSDEEKLRDKFEDALIAEGMLKTGVEAVGDEVGAGVKEDAGKLATLITSGVKGHVGPYPPTASPATFSPSTHLIADRAAAGSAVVAGYAASAAEAFVKGTIGLGERVVDVFSAANEGPVDPREKYARDLAEAGYSVEDRADDCHNEITYANTGKPMVGAASPAWKSVVSGISDGYNSVTSAAASGAQTMIGHEFGAEAADLSSKAGQTAQNVKAAATSTAVVGACQEMRDH